MRTTNKFFMITFLAGAISSSVALGGESLPEVANEEYPCFVRHDAQSGLGKLLTGRAGLERRNANYYLIPPMAKSEKWAVLANENNEVYCTGANGLDRLDAFFGKGSLKGRNALWKTGDGTKVYLFDFQKNEKVLVWSLIQKPGEYDSIWLDHLNHLAWSEKLYTAKANSQTPDIQILTDRLVTYQQALDIAKKYQSLNIGDGMWELPNFGVYLKSSAQGLTRLANGFTNYDNSKYSGTQSYRNRHWVRKPKGSPDDTQITFYGDQSFFSTTKSIFNSKSDVFYARFVITGENVKRLQASGIFPADSTERYKEDFEAQHNHQ